MCHLEVPMKTYRMLANASALFLIFAVVGCGSPDAEPGAAGPPRLAEPITLPEVVGSEMVGAIRGEATMIYVRPTVTATREGGRNFIVTTMEVKNMSEGSIAGLRVDEFWYNKAGTIVTGDNYRHRQPIAPEEVVTVTLEVPRAPGMDTNQIKFEHSNGAVNITLVESLDEPEEPPA